MIPLIILLFAILVIVLKNAGLIHNPIVVFVIASVIIICSAFLLKDNLTISSDTDKSIKSEACSCKSSNH